MELQFELEESIIEKRKPGKIETSQEKIKSLTGFDIGQCPKCKKGRMLFVRELPRIRSPCQTLQQLIRTVLQ